MKTCALPFCIFLLLLAAALTLACGTSSSTTRSATSLSVTPATADGSSGPVQFTATAYYSTQPSPVSPATATWGACYQSASTTEVSVSSSGVAQCGSGASGTFMIWAYVMNSTGPVCNVVGPCGQGCGRVTGSAQLTCP